MSVDKKIENNYFDSRGNYDFNQLMTLLKTEEKESKKWIIEILKYDENIDHILEICEMIKQNSDEEITALLIELLGEVFESSNQIYIKNEIFEQMIMETGEAKLDLDDDDMKKLAKVNFNKDKWWFKNKQANKSLESTILPLLHKLINFGKESIEVEALRSLGLISNSSSILSIIEKFYAVDKKEILTLINSVLCYFQGRDKIVKILNAEYNKSYERYEKADKLYELNLKTATLCENLEEDSEAVEFYEKALAIKESQEIIVLIANIYKKIEKFEKSLGFYNRALKYNEENKDIHENIADLNYTLQNFDVAVNSYLKYTQIDDKNPNVYNKIARCFLKLDKQENAIKYYEKSLEIDENHVSSLSHLGRIYFEKIDYERAIKYFERVVKVFEDDFEAYYFLARIYSILDKKEKAIEYLKQAVEKNEENENEIGMEMSFEHVVKQDFFLQNIKDEDEFKNLFKK